jgi:zinc protease
LVGTLASRLEEGRTLAFDRDIEKSLKDLTADQIITAMRKKIDLNKITMVQAGDFAKSKKGGATEAKVEAGTKTEAKPGAGGGTEAK